MIRNLHIENIALISKLDIDFDGGLVVLSGETGAGKSIIIDSLSFVLGERADKTLVKYGEEKAFVEVFFEAGEDSKAYKILEELGFEADTSIVIGRTLTLSGKNECRVNGRVCPTTALRQITAALVDIFGQSQHLSLLRVDNHIKVLDEFECDGAVKGKLRELYAEYREVAKKLNAFGGNDAERERLLDILRFQIDEISSAELSENEENDLTEMRARYLNVEKIVSSVTGALNFLEGNGMAASVGEAKNALAAAAQDRELNELHGRLDSVQIELDDITASLENILSEIDYNPAEIDKMEERLEKYKVLKKKYGGTVSDVAVFLEKAKEQYENLFNAAEIIEKLTAKQNALARELYGYAQKLSEKRRAAAKKFEGEIEAQLNDLGMKGTTFRVDFNGVPGLEEFSSSVSPEGYDKVEFLLSPNKGEPLKPLAKIISGGEMSRFMLAIKNITAKIEKIPTMVFDEIDIGISGGMAQMVAVKLANVSKDYQCIVITHLPQICAMADANMLIAKSVVGERTETRLTVLDENGKTEEVARLMGGKNIGEYSRLHAKEMIDWAKNMKAGRG